MAIGANWLENPDGYELRLRVLPNGRFLAQVTGPADVNVATTSLYLYLEEHDGIQWVALAQHHAAGGPYRSEGWIRIYPGVPFQEYDVVCTQVKDTEFALPHIAFSNARICRDVFFDELRIRLCAALPDQDPDSLNDPLEPT